MVSKPLKLAEVVITRVRPRQLELSLLIHREVELGGELKVNNVSGFKIAEEKIEFADGGVNVAPELEAFFKELKGRRFAEEGCEGVLVKVPQLLLQVERRDCFRERKMGTRESGCFREVSDEEGAFGKGVQEDERNRVRVGRHGVERLLIFVGCR